MMEQVIYSTYLGGDEVDVVYGLAINPTSGVVYVTGSTESDNFPTENPYDSSFNAVRDCFVTKLSSDGLSLNYSTFIGGDNIDYGKSIAIDTSGNIYIAGITTSSNFPTVNAYDSSYSTSDDAFVLILDEVPPTEPPTTPPTTNGDGTGFFNKIVGGLTVWAWFSMGGGVLILAILIPVLVITLKKRRTDSTDLKEKPSDSPETLPKSKIEETPAPITEAPKPIIEPVQVTTPISLTTSEGAMPFPKELKPSVFKRLLSAFIEYGITIILLVAGGVFIGTARSQIEIIAGVIVMFFAMIQFFMVRIPLLFNKKVFSGITSGKQAAKLRVVKVVDKQNMIIQPMPKEKKGIMIVRAFVSFIGFMTFPLYFLISFLTIVFSKYNRSILDIVTGTAVIKFDNKAEMAKLKDQK